MFNMHQLISTIDLDKHHISLLFNQCIIIVLILPKDFNLNCDLYQWFVRDGVFGVIEYYEYEC